MANEKSEIRDTIILPMMDDKKTEHSLRLVAGLTVPFVAFTVLAEIGHSSSCLPEPQVKALCQSRTVWALPIHTEINSFNGATPTHATVVATTSANSDTGFIFKTIDLRK